ncbi:hypothetical protein DW886_02245 [Enterocloster aldenensis]|uniref:amidase domain-containing protein n=1 Tax=Enterocloster aldenensis TaxID=358742 RepID=UPI000E5321BE|nr:hypothetical protein DW886_02245 [Enterocloster aldenensis]
MNHIRTLSIIALLCMLTGCSLEGQRQPFPAETVSAEPADSEPGMMEGTGQSEHGVLAAKDGYLLTREQEEIIFAYMERCYAALSSLEMQELEDLFDTEAKENLELNRSAWEYLIGLRTMQKTDLKLDSCQFELTIEELRWNGEKELSLRLKEDNIQRFTQHPDIDTEFYNIHHTFLLVQGREGWRIKEHLQDDGIYQNMMGTYRGGESRLAAENVDFYQSQKTALLEQARGQLQIREQLQSRYDSGKEMYFPKVRHEYDREAAAAYSQNWVGKRNAVWDDFTGQGGNCQNFVSQCLYAGGIPRDITGEQVWSWRKKDTDMPENQVGSDSWINVDAFRRYASENHRYGLAALPDHIWRVRLGMSSRWDFLEAGAIRF